MTRANESSRRTFIDKLASANSRNVARWTLDRVLGVRHWLSWHAARLRMAAYELLPLRGRLPPGSLTSSSFADATRDDRFYLKQFHRHGPIFKLFWGSKHLKICIVGYPLARRLLHQHSSFLGPVMTTSIASLVPADYLRGMSPAIHPRYRTLFVGALRNDLIVGCEADIRHIIRDELNRLVELVRSESPPALLLREALDRTTMRLLFLVVLGVRPNAEMFPRLAAAYHRLGPDGHVSAVGSEQRAAFQAIRDMVLQIVESLQHVGATQFSDSVLSRLTLAVEPLIDDTVIGNVIYMVERGRHDFRDLLRWLVKHLCDNPAVVIELRADASMPGTNPRLAEACVMESLRLEQAEAVGREVVVPFTLEGYHVPKGSWVGALMREAHQDPNVFPEPDRFRPQRFLERTYSANEYSPFGIDEHQCIARSLTIRAGTMFVDELVRGYSWTVATDGARTFNGIHWQPSPSFGIDIRRKP